MSFFSIPRTYGNLMRARQIAGVLAQHGFGHILSRLRLVDHIPGMGRIRVLVEGRHAADKDAPPEERLAHAMEELGATFIKLGQMLATRPDIVPPAYVKAFCRLQDRVEPFPGEESVKVIEASLGKKLNEVFRTFDPKPVASGSIGQVHFAELIDGSEVIVKVKRPGTDQKVRDDLDILKWLAELAESHIDELGPFKPVEFCEEFSHTMRRELDFVAEAAYTAKAREILKDEPLVIVPRIHWDFATRNVMVQERIHGIPLSNPDTMNLPFEKRQRIAAALGGAFMNQFFLAGLFHADPHPGNIFLLEDGRIALLDFGQAGHLSDELRHHLGLILVSLTQREFDTIADVYADMGGLADETDMQQFKSHMISLIDRYYGVPVDRIDFSSLFEEVLTMGRQHHISIPRDLVVLGKSFVTAVGVAQRLDPDFRMDAVAKPYANRLFRSEFDPRRALRSSAFGSYKLFMMLKKLPRDLSEVVRKAGSGKLRVIFHHEALEGLTHRLDRASNRLSLSVVLGAIIVGSSLVLTSDSLYAERMPFIGKVPIAYVIATLGFGAAVVLGFALIWSIIRSDKP